MTVKQVIVGGMLGVSALAVLLHRLPRPAVTIAMKPVLKHAPSSPQSPVRSAPRKASEDRLSSNKLLG